MKNTLLKFLMVVCMVFVLTLTFDIPNSYGAFAVKSAAKTEVVSDAPVAAPANTRRALPKINKAVTRLKSRFGHYGHDGGTSGLFSILSFAFGLSGFALVVAGIVGSIISGGGVALAVYSGLILGALGTTFGIIAIAKHNKLHGLTVAGMVLGISDIVIAAILATIVAIGFLTL